MLRSTLSQFQTALIALCACCRWIDDGTSSRPAGSAKEGGYALALLAISILPIILAIGLTVDLGLAYQGREGARAAAKSAAILATQRIAETPCIDPDTPFGYVIADDHPVAVDARSLAAANLKSLSPGAHTPDVVLTCQGPRSIAAEVACAHETVLMSLVEIDSFSAGARSVAAIQDPAWSPDDGIVPPVRIVK